MGKRNREEVRFVAVQNSKLVCKDCMFNKTGQDLAVLSCDIYSVKPSKVFSGGMCEDYRSKERFFEVLPTTRIFAESEDGESFILTNNLFVTFENLDMQAEGCLVNVIQETISPQLPIMVLTKTEYFGEVKTKLDLERVKTYRLVG